MTHPVMVPPALWQITIARRWPGHWCFDQRGRELRLLLAPAARGAYIEVLIRPGFWVIYEPRPDVYFTGRLCDSGEEIPVAVAKVLLRAAGSRSHGHMRDLLLHGHAPSGGHPAWLRSALA